ncbi:GntR family transcriptional regulator [Jiangella mangrovi]|uniref:DNA-binding GntR family transcriptional regulator n=1 Tax=Jiangella mangrovi TaxID=1524084 RepID=A0A7W9LNF5_9ACTN|nr:GntR family transcriptional regulator [Jiangella mangrovi]MBB5790270.1 DNA-binding GntR family transcriptional regulator [Jiangella mangrovi]
MDDRPAPVRANRPTTSEEFAYHALRTDILTGRIEAGSRVVQSDVAEQLGVSVTPVREAMRRLHTEGLVELAPHRGATVVRLELAKVREIYDLRILLEPRLVERSLPLFDTGRTKELEKLCDEMDVETGVSHFAELNQRFHDSLVTSDDSWLSRIVTMLRVASSPYVALSLHAVPSLMKVSNAEHRRMLRAFIEQDLDAARELTVHHLSSTVVALEDHL